MNKQNRIEWIDIVKGITILIVIAGHTYRNGFIPGIIRGAIFSYHMPLFFIVSSITFKYSENTSDLIRNIRKSAKHLLIPAFLICAINLGYEAYVSYPDLHSVFNVQRIFVYIFSSGAEVHWGDMAIKGIGTPWFFVALFAGRTIYDYLHMSFSKLQLPAVCVIMSILGICIGQYQPLPFCLDITFALLPFFYVGSLLKEHPLKKNAGPSLVLWFVIWAVSFWLTFPTLEQWTYLELAVRRYPIYPVCYIAAIAGTLFWCYVGRAFEKVPVVKSVFSFIGRNSLYILLIHCLDYMPVLHDIWSIEDRPTLSTLLRISLNLAIFFILYIIHKAASAALRNKS